MKRALTIAGSDSSGGAGIQADIKTMTSLDIYGMSAITALTAQNTMGVMDIMEVSPKFLEKQLDSIFTDIFPHAIKIGMVSSVELIEVISERLNYYDGKNIVIDPVMVSTSGSKLLQDNSIESLKRHLFPLGILLTPNIPEGSILSGITIENEGDMMKAAKSIGDEYNSAVLLKGGHSINDANDVLYMDNEFIWFRGERIENPNTHGTGCTLSSAIASYLALGNDLSQSIRMAKKYISGALKSMLNLGRGRGPLNHMWNIGGKNERI